MKKKFISISAVEGWFYIGGWLLWLLMVYSSHRGIRDGTVMGVVYYSQKKNSTARTNTKFILTEDLFIEMVNNINLVKYKINIKIIRFHFF